MKKIDWENSKNTSLIRAFLSLNKTSEMEVFLRDLMTAKEIDAFANRLEAAFLLSQSASYRLISERTGLSSTTIARIAKWLKGPFGGYRRVMSSLHHNHSPQIR